MLNLLSVTLLVGAVILSYSLMLLNFKQAQLLTLIAIGAGVISSLAYGLMTIPVTRSVRKLMQFAEQVGEGKLHPDAEEALLATSGPQEIRQLAKSIQEMKMRLHNSFRRLETMEKTRRELIANVSHDLRTPITTIRSYVEALDDQVIDDRDTSQVYLRTIHREVNRLSSLIDDLFELSKLEAGQQAYRPVPSQIDQVILGVLEGYSLRIHEKGLRVLVEVADDVPGLLLMPEKIARVLSNLLDNAIRHSSEGSMLEVRARPLLAAGGHEVVEVAVRDEGEGISGEHEEHIFERFFRTDASRNRDSGGAGLGLAIARSLVELHGGQIGLRTPKGGSGEVVGSEFWFTLPVGKSGNASGGKVRPPLT